MAQGKMEIPLAVTYDGVRARDVYIAAALNGITAAASASVVMDLMRKGASEEQVKNELFSVARLAVALGEMTYAAAAEKISRLN